MNESIKNNKLVIFICIGAIALVLLYSFLTKKDDSEFKYINDDITYSKKYKINEAVPIYINDERMAQKYLSDFINLICYNSEEAYKLQDVSYKKFNSVEEFNFYFNQIMTTNFISAKLKSYKTYTENGLKHYHVIDLDGNDFTFIEKSIMNYTVIMK